MIVWGALRDYFLLTAENLKIAVLSILVFALIFRRTSLIKNVYQRLARINPRAGIFAILAVAFLLRLGWIIWSPHAAPSAGTEDMVMIQHARDLAEGHGYRTLDGAFSADRPIGFALWLSLFFRTLGENLFIVELVQVLWQVIAIFLIFYLARQTIHPPGIAYLSAFLLAIYPTSVFASKVLLEEHIFIPLWLSGILLLVLDFQKPKWLKIICAGLIFGVSAHFRTFSFAMGLVVFSLWFFSKRGIRMALKRALIVQLLILVLALPWAVRNYYRLGAPVLYSTWVGTVLYFANNHISDVRYPVNPTLAQGGDPEFIFAKNELNRSRAGQKAALRWIFQHPGTFFQKAIGRVIYMMGIDREGWIVKDNFYTIRQGRLRPPEGLIAYFDRIDNDYYRFIILFALFGLFLFIFSPKLDLKEQSFWCVIWTLGYYLSIVAITLNNRKYRFAIEPLLCLLAAYGFYLSWFGYVQKPKQAVNFDNSK